MDTFLLHRKTVMTWWFWIIVALGISLIIMFGSNAGAAECLRNDKEVRAKFPGSWPSWRGDHCWFPSDKKTVQHTKTRRRVARGESKRAAPTAQKEWTDSSHIITWMMVTSGKMAKLREDRKALNARIQEWFYIQATYKPFCGPTPDWQSCTVSPREVQSIPEPRQNSIARISRTDNARVGKMGRGKGEGGSSWDTAAYFR